MVDFTAVAALFVSLVALVVTFTQVIQQYAATGYDYRRCSARTMGGWAKRTHRKFIWREVRFEVTFSTPRITIGFSSQNKEEHSQNVKVLHSQDQEEHFSTVDVTHPQTSKSDALYCLKGVSRDGKESESSEWYNIEDKPWFLAAETTIPEAKCPWLNFLEDMASTNLKITMTETRSSYDFVPEGLQRPVATMDGSSFLTVLSLLGIQWTRKGVDGTFTGIADSGRCEISSTNIFNFGEVYLYRRTPRLGRSVEQSIPDLNRTRYYVVSETARQAMFNCFDLGFATIRTHDSSEFKVSLRRLHIQENRIQNFVRYFNDSGGWCPGVRDAIGCWAAASMPKMVTKTTNDKDEYEYEFRSVFSGCSATPLMGDSPFAAMLLGGDHNDSHYKERFDSIDTVKTLTEWAKEYLASLPRVTENLLHDRLKWIASQKGNVMTDFIRIPYSESAQCLKGILALDDHLDSYLLSQSEVSRPQFKQRFCSEQIECQYEFPSDMDKAHRDYGGGKHRPWYFEADRVGSAYYCKLADNIALFFEIDSRLAQQVVVNRLMRASLWSVHNGNAPTASQRSLECSLSSHWLQQNFTVYVF